MTKTEIAVFVAVGAGAFFMRFEGWTPNFYFTFIGGVIGGALIGFDEGKRSAIKSARSLGEDAIADEPCLTCGLQYSAGDSIGPAGWHDGHFWRDRAGLTPAQKRRTRA
jgi:hypothetical protein